MAPGGGAAGESPLTPAGVHAGIGIIMKVIILAAGQGKRLHPHTENRPKCLVPVAGDCTMLGWQLQQLAIAGVREVVVVTGFQADKVEAEAARYRVLLPIRTRFNPEFAHTDNLCSAAFVRDEMDRDFIILNGDTLFTSPLALGLMAAPAAPVTVTITRKAEYDADDMKVVTEDGRLRAVGKTLEAATVNGESIGMIRFQGEGVGAFREAVGRAVAEPEGQRRFYLSVIHTLAQEQPVAVYEANRTDWTEVDSPPDLEHARRCTMRWVATAGRK